MAKMIIKLITSVANGISSAHARFYIELCLLSISILVISPLPIPLFQSNSVSYSRRSRDAGLHSLPVINSDADVCGRLKVIFLENYRVSLAEKGENEGCLQRKSYFVIDCKDFHYFIHIHCVTGFPYAWPYLTMCDVRSSHSCS